MTGLKTRVDIEIRRAKSLVDIRDGELREAKGKKGKREAVAETPQGQSRRDTLLYAMRKIKHWKQEAGLPGLKEQAFELTVRYKYHEHPYNQQPFHQLDTSCMPM